MSEINREIFLHQKGVGGRNRISFANCELGFAIGQQIKEEEGQEAFNKYQDRYSKIII